MNHVYGLLWFNLSAIFDLIKALAWGLTGVAPGQKRPWRGSVDAWECLENT
jgi:hypothetical protein